jgi:hypothetical protein
MALKTIEPGVTPTPGPSLEEGKVDLAAVEEAALGLDKTQGEDLQADVSDVAMDSGASTHPTSN